MKIKLFLYKPLTDIFGPIEHNRWYDAEQTFDNFNPDFSEVYQAEQYVNIQFIGPNGQEYEIGYWDGEHTEYFLTLEQLRDRKINTILYENQDN